MKSFLEKNKVFISGLVGLIVITLQQFAASDKLDWKVIGVAVFITTLSYIANQWRGQGVTILGIIGTLSGVFVQVQQAGTIDWNQFIYFSMIAVLSAVAPPPKAATYETNKDIVEAKKEPPVQQVVDQTPILPK